MADPHLTEIATTTQRNRQGMSKKQSRFYSNGPYAPASKKADSTSLPSPAVGQDVPKTVPQHPGRTSGLGGPAHVMSRQPKKGSHGFGHSIIQRLGAVRLSGHSNAHRIGKRGS